MLVCSRLWPVVVEVAVAAVRWQLQLDLKSTVRKRLVLEASAKSQNPSTQPNSNSNP